MLKVVATNVVISKGYDNNPALKFHNGENGRSVRFRIGNKTYDSSAPNNSRWVNIAVKAFNGMCDRIEKMKLDEGSYVNIYGKLDEETWNDSEGKPKSAMVIIVDDIEYAGSGKPKDNTTNGNNQQQNTGNTTASTPSDAAPPEPSAGNNFTGYQNFGGSGSLFNEQ